MVRQSIRLLLSISSLSIAAACGATPEGYSSSLGAFERAPAIDLEADAASDQGPPFAGDQPLTAAALVRAVLARNPSLERARQGWRAALAQVDQATSLEDPVLGAQIRPLSFDTPGVRAGYGAEIGQKVPWFGKRRLRGEIALAEAEARGEGWRKARQHLALMAVGLALDYALVERGLEINAEHLELLDELSRTANAYLETGRATQDDALEIDVDAARRRRQRLGLEADRESIRAQINALLHRRAAASLPPPAELAEPPPAGQSLERMTAVALEQRPELRALEHRARGSRAAIDLAEKSDYPDFRFSASFNHMFAAPEHWLMFGVGINLPIWRARRSAEKRQARARAREVEADRAATEDAIRQQVDTAASRLAEALSAVKLYRDELVPAAADRVKAIRIGLDAGRADFLEVIRAEDDLRAAELELATAIADAGHRRAELDWALGIAPAAAGETP